MKNVVCTVTGVAGLLILVGMGATAVAQAPSALDRLTAAKAVFERTCSVCHGLDRPLSKTFDKAGWEKLVETMKGKGAKATADEQAQIVDYLLTKNTFEAKCADCHGIDRPLGKSKSAADWLATVQRMAGKKSGHLTDAEVASIAAYLALVRPAQ